MSGQNTGGKYVRSEVKIKLFKVPAAAFGQSVRTCGHHLPPRLPAPLLSHVSALSSRLPDGRTLDRAAWAREAGEALLRSAWNAVATWLYCHTQSVPGRHPHPSPGPTLGPAPCLEPFPGGMGLQVGHFFVPVLLLPVGPESIHTFPIQTEA